MADPTRKSTLSWRDLLVEVGRDLTVRFGRTALTALGTLIGIAVLVSTLGLAASLQSQIMRRFDALTPAEVTVLPAADQGELGALPFDAPNRARAVTGVVTAGLETQVKTVRTVTGNPGFDPVGTAGLPVYAVSAGFAPAVKAQLRGVGFDELLDDRGEPVAVLGRSAADQLGITDVARRPVVFLDDRPLTVIGIVESLERRTPLLQGVWVPFGYARKHLGVEQAERLLVDVKVGWANVVAEQLPLALRPDHPELLTAQVPPAPEQTRAEVSGDTFGLFVVLAVISLVIGGIGIANITLVSVLERTAEIGLRRAIGARRRDIVVQFLATSTAIGFVGAIVGAAVGVLVTLVVALSQGWPPTLHPVIPLVSPVLGALIGLLAGIYPSYRAAAVEPITALRAGS